MTGLSFAHFQSTASYLDTGYIVSYTLVNMCQSQRVEFCLPPNLIEEQGNYFPAWLKAQGELTLEQTDPEYINACKFAAMRMEDLDNGSGRIQGGTEIIDAISTRVDMDPEARQAALRRHETARLIGSDGEEPHSIARALNKFLASDLPKEEYINACHPLCTGKMALVPPAASQNIFISYEEAEDELPCVDPSLLYDSSMWHTDIHLENSEPITAELVAPYPSISIATTPTKKKFAKKRSALAPRKKSKAIRKTATVSRSKPLTRITNLAIRKRRSLADSSNF